MLTASGFHPLIPRGRILPDNSDSQRYRKESGHLGVWEQMLLQGGWPVTGLVSLAMERKGQDGVGDSNDLSSTSASWARAGGPNSLRNSASHWPGLSLHIHMPLYSVCDVCVAGGDGGEGGVCVYMCGICMCGGGYQRHGSFSLSITDKRNSISFLHQSPHTRLKKKSITPW